MPTPEQLLLNQHPILSQAVSNAVHAVQVTAASPTNEMRVPAVLGATQELEKNITVAIASDPVLQNVLNLEPHFWMKRTFWAQVGAYFAAICSASKPVLDYLQAHMTHTGTNTISLIGLGMALWSARAAYRAGKASAPLFSKKRTLPPYLEHDNPPA